MLTYDEGERPAVKSHIFGVGDTLKVRCHGCPQWFTWVVPNAWWDSVPHHHSKNCNDRQRKRRLLKQEQEGFRCPTPFKKTHATWESGREEARKQAMGKNLLYGAYRCDCGGIHVGHADFSVVKRVV